jgi:hypothetical protein
MELKFEVFVILVLLLVSIILVSLDNLKPDMASMIIYLLATFLLISFFVLFLISKNKKEHLSKIPPTKSNKVVTDPTQNNLYPKDLIPLANKEFDKCKPAVRPIIPECKKDECDNVNDKCNNYNLYPIVTPNLPKNTITKGQCAICKISPEESIEY